jgi:hypothetical protein
MELVIKKINPDAMKMGGIYRVIGEYEGISINVLAVCVKADDNGGEYTIIKDYNISEFNCYGDLFRLDTTNYNNFTTFIKVSPKELQVYLL